MFLSKDFNNQIYLSDLPVHTFLCLGIYLLHETLFSSKLPTNIVTGYHRSSISEISQVSQQLFTLRKTEDSSKMPTLKNIQLAF